MITYMYLIHFNTVYISYMYIYIYICEVERLHKALQNITKGSFSGATFSFALRSKGEGGQFRYLIIQEVAVHFRDPPPLHPITNRKMGFVIFAWTNYFLQHAENCSVLSKKHCEYRGFCYQKQKNIINTVVLGFRGRKHIGIYGVFFAPRVSKKTKTPTI